MVSGIRLVVAFAHFSHASKNELLPGSAFWLVLLFAALLFWQGLSGDFLLDDYENLRKLELISGISPFHEILNFLSTGLSSKLGRPVSLLTFAAQYYYFPQPWAFKYINVLIHLINGCLVFWVLILTTRLSGFFGEKAHWVAFVAAAAWLVHPIQISTVHYVIQRMTELSALFTLVGIILYLIGRTRFMENRPLQGYLWTSTGIVLGGCLATLSKENGILLPLYVLTMEFTLFKDLPQPRRWNLWRVVFLITPLLILFAYLGYHFKGIVINSYSYRDFTLSERILTETRVLSDYLFKIFIPLPNKLGLYHDNFIVSKTLFAPWDTFIASAFLIFLLSSALYLRKSAPVYSFGILWFFSGHLLESTVIPLELYFEHRNYLPVLGILLCAVHYGAKIPGYIHTEKLKKFAVAIAMMYAATIVFISYSENALWGDVYRQSITWAAENPRSRRAQDALGAVLTASEQYRQAALVYKNMGTTFSRDSAPYVIWLSLTCLDDKLQAPPIDTVLHKLKNSPLQISTMTGISRIVEAKESNSCTAVNNQDVERMIQALMQNPNYKKHTMFLHLYLGRLYASERLLAPAMMEYDKAFAMSHKPDLALQQVRWLFSAGLYEEALNYLTKAEQAANRNPMLYMSLEPVFKKWHTILESKNG